MTNKASDSTSGAGMETVAWSYVPSDAWVDVVLTDDQEKALSAAEFGRPVTDLVRRTDASRLLAEREERIAKLEAALTALRRSHDADVDGHGLTVGQLLVINEALKD